MLLFSLNPNGPKSTKLYSYKFKIRSDETNPAFLDNFELTPSQLPPNDQNKAFNFRAILGDNNFTILRSFQDVNDIIVANLSLSVLQNSTYLRQYSRCPADGEFGIFAVYDKAVVVCRHDGKQYVLLFDMKQTNELKSYEQESYSASQGLEINGTIKYLNLEKYQEDSVMLSILYTNANQLNMDIYLVNSDVRLIKLNAHKEINYETVLGNVCVTNFDSPDFNITVDTTSSFICMQVALDMRSLI